MTRILIADDCSALRFGVRELLKQIPGTVFGAEAVNGPEILKIFSKQEINLLVLDLWMNGDYCAGTLTEVKRLYPKTRALVYGARPEEELGWRAFRAGADGFVGKGSPLKELLGAIQQVMAGRKYCSPSLQATLLCRLQGNGHKTPVEKLSEREYAVSVMLGNGESYKDIADKLSISMKTVGTYRARIFEKLHLAKNADLTRYQSQNERRGPEQAESAALFKRPWTEQHQNPNAPSSRTPLRSDGRGERVQVL